MEHIAEVEAKPTSAALADPPAAQLGRVRIDPGARHAERGGHGRGVDELDRGRL
jgi:hypothetical protein